MSIHFQKAIIFCSNPLPGCLRFDDYFQIYPWKSDAAPTSDKLKTFPVALEYFVDNSEVISVPKEMEEIGKYISLLTKSNNKQREILQLLSTFTNYRFFYPTPEFQWFVPIPDGELSKELNNERSKYGLNIFTYPEIGKEQFITEFSKQEAFNFKKINHTDYYTHVDLEGKEEIRLPERFEETIDKYIKLPADSLRSVNSSMSLICNGIDLRTKMKSLSFVSFVSSIETMVDTEFKNQKVEFECKSCQSIKSSPFNCPDCGRPVWGIAAKFREYLAKYVSSSDESRKKINRIYNTRSKIIHTGLLLLGDNNIDWSSEQKSEQEWQAHLDVMQTARIGVVNWLLMNK